MTLPVAIAHVEGFYATDPNGQLNRPQRNNNPGDLMYEPWMESYGGKLETVPPEYDERPEFACFPTVAEGFSALYALLSSKLYSDLTIHAAISIFAPPLQNDTQGYVDMVCSMCGCSDADRVSDVLAMA